MKNLYRFLIVAIFIVQCILSIGQNTKIVSDLELRTGVEISKEVWDDFELSYNQELRLYKNAGEFDKTFAEFGAKYKLNKYIKFGIDYRLSRNQQYNGGFENQQRLAAKIYTKYKIDRFTLKYRFQFQNKDEDFWGNDSGNYNVYSLRNKFSVSYNIPKNKLKPEFSAELFRRYYNNSSEFNKLRIGADISYPVKKWVDAELGYYFERELNSTQPASINIMKLGLKFNF